MGLDLSKSMSISLHFALFNCMPCCDPKVPISLAIMSSMVIDVLGMNSTTVRSSTYLAVKFQFLVRLLIRTAKTTGASFVPCGIPPRSVTAGESVLHSKTLCDLFGKKDPTHLTTTSLTPRYRNSLIRTLWFTRSKPLLKSVKSIYDRNSYPSLVNLRYDAIGTVMHGHKICLGDQIAYRPILSTM